MALDHVPVTSLVGIDGRRFEHKGGGTVQQWAIHDVGVSGDPSTIRDAGKQITRLQIKGDFGGQFGVQGVSTGGMEQSLGFSRASGGVQNKKIVFGVHVDRGTVRAHGCHQDIHSHVFGAHVVGCHALDSFEETLPDQDRLANRVAIQFGQGGVDDVFERDRFASAFPNIGGDQEFRFCRTDALTQGFGRKPGKDDRMNGTDSGTGQHGHGQLGDHGHVNGNDISFLDSRPNQGIGNLTNFAEDFVVGEFANVGGFISFPNQGHLVAFGGNVSVESVVADVELASGKPTNVTVAKTSLEGFFEGTEPIQVFLGLRGPECFGILDALFVLLFVLVKGDFALGGNQLGELTHGCCCCFDLM